MESVLEWLPIAEQNLTFRAVPTDEQQLVQFIDTHDVWRHPYYPANVASPCKQRHFAGDISVTTSLETLISRGIWKQKKVLEAVMGVVLLSKMFIFLEFI